MQHSADFLMTHKGLHSGRASMSLFLTTVPGLCDQGNISYKDRKFTSPLGEFHLVKLLAGTRKRQHFK